MRALPRLNVLLTSSFTGWNNYMMDLGKMTAGAYALFAQVPPATEPALAATK